jgi:hypothetical protein
MRLSLRQTQGKPPEGGFLQKVLGGTEDYYKAAEEGRLGYRRGIVVKICGDYDPHLKKTSQYMGSHNQNIRPMALRGSSRVFSEKLVVRDSDIKAIVGDIIHDYIGIGDERHRRGDAYYQESP